MSQLAEKRESSIAWFRLAELVSRGEKEKALNLYRLLSHSFDDRAYALQVEGDILWSFEDDEALNKYKQAAFLYRKEQKLTAAVSLYENIFALQPESYEVLSHLVSFYVQLDWMEKVQDRFGISCSWYTSHKITMDQMWGIAQSMVDTISHSEPKSLKECSLKNVLKLMKNFIPELVDKTKLYAMEQSNVKHV